MNGFGSVYAQLFEMMIYALILLSVAVGAWQTVDGEQRAFVEVECVAVEPEPIQKSTWVVRLYAV